MPDGADGTHAVIDAGYKVTRMSSIHSMCWDNLKKPLILLELERQGYKDCGLISSDAAVEVRKTDEKNNRISSRS